MDKYTAYQRALSQIGGGDYTPGAGTEHPCDQWWPLVLREACSRYNWSFTRRIAHLAQQEDGTWHLPADCLTILSCTDCHRRRPSYIIPTGRILHTDLSGELTLLYTSDYTASMQELPDSSPEFCSGVIFLLAARAARTITGDTNVATYCETQSEKYFQRAITRDAQSEASNKLRPLPSILARNIFTQ